MNNLKDVLDRMDHVEEKNGVYWANCPCHNDMMQSVMVTTDNGRLEMACSVCGAGTRQIMDALYHPKKDDVHDECGNMFKRLNEFKEEQANWFVPGWIPEGQITLLAANGGLGKTTLWTDIVASASAGKRCILDPKDHQREPVVAAFFSAEDSVSKVLLRKLVDAGANLDNIVTMDLVEDKKGLLRNFKFGSAELERFVCEHRPKICVFDPIQAFLPSKVNMGSRNEMRDCLAPLIALGEKTGTTFLLVCHTNKRKSASGRDRISDSADLWDISRSVMMMGHTEEEGIRYLSHEKSNYGEQQDTILYSINQDGIMVREGSSKKRDWDYVADAGKKQKANRVEPCKRDILKLLTEAPEHIMRSPALKEEILRRGYTEVTHNRARGELSDDGYIRCDQIYSGSMKGWYVRLCADGEPKWEEPVPFDQKPEGGQDQK